MLSLRHRLEYLVFQTFVCLIDSLSPRATASVARCLATLIHYCLPRKWTRYAVARDNLVRAFGDRYSERQIEILVYEMWVHLFRTIAETVQAPRKLHLHSYRSIVDFADFTRTNEAICSGRRVLMLGGHFGNWEIGTALFGLLGFFRWGSSLAKWTTPICTTGFADNGKTPATGCCSSRETSMKWSRCCRKGAISACFCDQDAGPRGVFVDFFGSPASTFKSIALLALEYDALVMVGYSIRLEDQFGEHSWSRFEVGCEAVIDPRKLHSEDPVGEITRLFTAALETGHSTSPRAILLDPPQVEKRTPQEKMRNRSSNVSPGNSHFAPCCFGGNCHWTFNLQKLSVPISNFWILFDHPHTVGTLIEDYDSSGRS